MKALGLSLLLLLTAWLSACLGNELIAWRVDRLTKGRDGAWLGWLQMQGQIRRVK